MVDDDQSEHNITISPPDFSLLHKIGSSNLDRLFSPAAISKAERIILSAADDFYTGCLEELTVLKNLADSLKNPSSFTEKTQKAFIAKSFDLKAKAGQAGYDLVATIAKSLHMLCQHLQSAEMDEVRKKTLEWHIESVSQLLARKINGDGGEIGKAILTEIRKISQRFHYPMEF